MSKITRLSIVAALLAGPALVVLAQVAPPSSTVQPPATRPAAAPPATMPATAPAATAPASTEGAPPSAQSVLEGLLKDQTTPAPQMPAATQTDPALLPAIDPAAPEVPKTTRLREGQMIWNRTGRLLRNEKAGTEVFEFDSDGKGMADPPITLLPSHLLMSMENASDKGAKPVKFKITGEVTEYRGKNYLYVRNVQQVRDLNQGLGG